MFMPKHSYPGTEVTNFRRVLPGLTLLTGISAVPHATSKAVVLIWWTIVRICTGDTSCLDPADLTSVSPPMNHSTCGSTTGVWKTRSQRWPGSGHCAPSPKRRVSGSSKYIFFFILFLVWTNFRDRSGV